jgi:signal transduction histidine kinase
MTVLSCAVARQTRPPRAFAWRYGALWVASLVMALAASSAAQPVVRNVLVLNSPEHDPFKFHTGVFRAELSRRSAAPINFFEVSIQPPVLPVAALGEDPVVEYLRATLSQRKLDLVVAVGGPAAVFAQRYRERLFPGAPLLHSAVESRFLKDRTFTANEIAAAGKLDVPQIVENMLVLLPDTTNVFVVIGASQLEDFWRRELARELERFHDRLTFVWFNELSFEEIMTRAAALPAHSAILYPILSMDGKGVLHSQDQALTRLQSATTAPIFGIYDFQLGHGIVGGPLISMTEAARHSADVALRILQGESPQHIQTVLQTHGRPTYDWRELRRWGISEARLPAGSVVQFRQPSVWDLYKGYVVIGISIVGLQTVLIAGLVLQRARRRRIELALRESEQHSRESEAALRRSYEQNQDLSGRLINAQEAERTRIARDLHDDVSQQLAGVGIMLAGLKRKLGKPELAPEVEQTVASLQGRTSTLADAIRNLSHELHPSVLQHTGLVATLTRHCAEIERHHDVKVAFSSADDLASLSPDAALCLFRVAQEALANAVRHARAHVIHVQLKAANEGVELEIVDDGIGFVPSERKGGGLGLRSVDERVRLAHGTVRVASSPMHGTRVQVWLPIDVARTRLEAVHRSVER